MLISLIAMLSDDKDKGVFHIKYILVCVTKGIAGRFKFKTGAKWTGKFCLEFEARNLDPTKAGLYAVGVVNQIRI